MSKQPEDRVADARVSDTYRELAKERVPDHLNAKVLRMAAGRRTPYARARAWMRPAAWAATIGLSLAIVLELTQLPLTEDDAVSLTLPQEAEDTRRKESAEDSAAAPAAMDMPSTAPERTTVEAPQETSPRQDMEPKSELAVRHRELLKDAEALAVARSGADQGPESTAAASDVADEMPMPGAMSQDMAAAERAEVDRMAAKRVSAEARSAAAAFLAGDSDALAAERACGALRRETPESWLDCIDELRDAGLEELADGEYEEFRRVFPDFDDSVTDK